MKAGKMICWHKPYKGVISMATQIAPTPVVKGSEAERILKEANKKTSAEAKKGSKKLSNLFDKVMK